MNLEDFESLALLAEDVACAASEIALAGFRTGARIDRKQATELVTEFDFATEAVIRQRLSSVSSIPVVGEEAGGKVEGDRVWYVDPIDGTTNYAHGHPFWAVSIGLVVEGVSVVGSVVAPCLGLRWLAWRGGPALRNGKPCRVSETKSIGDALLSTGFPYDRQTSPDNNIDAFSAMQKRAVGIRRCGSAAIDLCLVADGTYDGYWEKKLRPWDIAAGIGMVEAAGGLVSCPSGGPIDLKAGHVVASNPHLHETILGELQRVARGE